MERLNTTPETFGDKAKRISSKIIDLYAHSYEQDGVIYYTAPFNGYTFAISNEALNDNEEYNGTE